MEKYIGVKLIKAMPMNRGEYCRYRGWQGPEDENKYNDGYLVEYLDSPSDAHPDHAGYISWSPKDVFEEAYRRITDMTFGLAIEAAKKGMKIARRGWNGKGMFVELMHCGVAHSMVKYNLPGNNKFLQQFLSIDTTGLVTDNPDDRKFVVPWLASQTDMLAEDWFIVE